MVLGRNELSQQEAFTREVAGLLAEMPAVESVKVQGPLHLFVRYNNGAKGDKFLGSLWVHTRNMTPQERAERILDHLASAQEMGLQPTGWGKVRSHILPVLRNPRILAAPMLKSGSVARALDGVDSLDQPVYQAVSPFLLSMAVIDQKRTMTHVMHHHLNSWGVTAEGLLTEALANLSKTKVKPHVAPALVMATQPRSYGSSWLLVPGIFDEIAEIAGDEVVAVTPERDSAYFIKWRYVQAVQQALDLALKQYAKDPYAVSPVYYYQDAQHSLQQWVPPADYPGREDILRASAVLCQTEYEKQRLGLQELAAKTGEGVFVARVGLYQAQSGVTVTETVWPKDVTNALLPYLVDEVRLIAPGSQEAITVRWADLEQFAAPFLRHETGLYPPRVRISGWPADVLPELRARARR